jgi:hypothetical protein
VVDATKSIQDSHSSSCALAPRTSATVFLICKPKTRESVSKIAEVFESGYSWHLPDRQHNARENSPPRAKIPVVGVQKRNTL